MAGSFVAAHIAAKQLAENNKQGSKDRTNRRGIDDIVTVPDHASIEMMRLRNRMIGVAVGAMRLGVAIRLCDGSIATADLCMKLPADPSPVPGGRSA